LQKLHCSAAQDTQRMRRWALLGPKMELQLLAVATMHKQHTGLHAPAMHDIKSCCNADQGV